jgi:hypothetical protein
MFDNEFNSDNEPICPLCRKPVTQDDIDRKNTGGAMRANSVTSVTIVHLDCFRTLEFMRDFMG